MLLAALRVAGVHIQVNARIKSIRQVKNSFYLLSDKGDEFTCDQLVLAFGGKAQPKLGADGSLFSEVKKLGHSVIPLSLALAPLTAHHNPLHALQGIRLDAGVRLWKNDQLLGESKGNLIITEWGFNGPAVMDISHLVSQNANRPLMLELNLLAFHKNAFDELLDEKRKNPLFHSGFFWEQFFPTKSLLYY